MNIDTLATAAHGRAKPNKTDIWETITRMIDEAPDDQPWEQRRNLVALYNHFMPAIPAKPKTPQQWIGKALAKKDVREYLQLIKSDGKRIYATDGHRLHIYQTDKYPDGMYDSQLNRVADSTQYPNIDRVLPKGNLIGITKDTLLGSAVVRVSGMQAMLIEGIRFNLKYLHDALCGFPDAINYYMDKDTRRLRIEGDDKIAVIMGMLD